MCSPSSWWQPLPLIASALGVCRSLGLTVFCAWLHACCQCLGVANAGDDLLNHLLPFTSIARPAVLELCLFAAACCARMLSELIRDVFVGILRSCFAALGGQDTLCCAASHWVQLTPSQLTQSLPGVEPLQQRHSAIALALSMSRLPWYGVSVLLFTLSLHCSSASSRWQPQLV